MLDVQILGFLDASPLHGYELRRRIDELRGSARKVSDGTLYPALRRLERDGHVTRHEEPGTRGRARQVLTLTDVGRSHLRTLLREVDGADLEDLPSFMTVLAFLSCLPDEADRLAVLGRRLACLERAPSFFYDGRGRPVRSADEPDPYRRAMLLTAAASREAEIAWLRDHLATHTARSGVLAREIRELTPSAPPSPVSAPSTPPAPGAMMTIPPTTATTPASNSRATMLAARLEAPGSLDHLHLVHLPVPEPTPGWVRIQVMAFGLNRSEYHSILGMAEGMTFPRVLGIEASGVVDLDPDGVLAPGTQVVTLMGGMGREFDGGYAQYVVVPREQVIPFASSLPWERIGSVPETLQTAYGALTIGLDAQPGQTLLVRGGTSALGLAAAALATSWGCRVLATTRQAARMDLLASRGTTPVMDDGNIATRVRDLAPGGVDGVLELVGVPTVRDSLAATAVHGTVCFAGMLSDSWTIPNFYPMDWIPLGVRLTTYSGGAAQLPPAVLQATLDEMADGGDDLVPIRTYPLSQIHRAHRDLATGTHVGKLVGLPWTD